MTGKIWQDMKAFYNNKNILVTGHTGFKGIWLTKMLQMLEARVTGFSLEPPTEEGKLIFPKIIGNDVRSIKGDVRDYEDPVYTYDVNVMGTVNFMECVRKSNTVRSCVVVTTDKVYDNKEWAWGYRENDTLNGKDPYANSKSCAELVVSCYKKSFLSNRDIAISTMRAGNVIGGGDFSKDRIIPDCVRAVMAGNKIHVRNPHSLRPYQHVMEALSAYLLVAFKQFENSTLADSYNIGPCEQDALTTGQIADMFCNAWGDGLNWYSSGNGSADNKEARLLWLDCSKIKTIFGWQPVWEIQKAIEKTAVWYKGYMADEDLKILTEHQIEEYWKGGMAHGQKRDA